VAVEIDVMYGGVAVLRHGGVAAWKPLRRGSLEGIVAWRFGWRGEGERNERENEMRE
jgi:hypothetical protein